jgi:methylation protein EvaC
VHIGRIDDEVVNGSVTLLLLEERWMLDPRSLTGMQGRAGRIRHRLRDILWEQSRAGKRVAGYGASGKSTTLLNYCEIGPELVQYFVDSTPTKHGRFTPGTGIPIIDPRSDSRAPDVYACFVWNYIGPIMRRESSFSGQWLVPIPIPILL